MPAQHNARMKAHGGGNVVQITGDGHVSISSNSSPEVSWPIWVGAVPRLAAAFQPRSAVRDGLIGPSRRALSIVLTGDGGVGKSQLAAFLARKLREKTDAESVLDLLVWTNAADPDQVITAYAAAAERLGLTRSFSGDLTATARAFLEWLATTRRRWLIVLDDITDPAGIDAWWPDGDQRNGAVLATTRRRDALLSGQGRRIVEVGLYTEHEACSYIQRRLTDSGHPLLYQPRESDCLAEELGYLPLALGHAAAYMINKRCRTEEYLALLRDTHNHLRDLFPSNADTEGYGRPVVTALLISLNAVQATDQTGLARPLLELMAMMDPGGHPADLWGTSPVAKHLQTSLVGRLRWFRKRNPVVTAHSVGAALDRLRTFALIAQDTSQEPIRLHALTARAVRESIPAPRLPLLARIAADAIISIWPDLDQHDRNASAMLRRNAMFLDQHSHPSLWKPSTHQCIYQVSMSLTAAGLYEQALAYDQRIVEQNAGLHGPDHPDTLTSRSNLALSFRDAGRTREALHLREQVVTDHERILGTDHPHTLISRSNLALAYRDAGRAREALQLRKRVLADVERLFGTDHPRTLASRSNLANSYRDAGRVQEALQLRKHVLADVERLFGTGHPRTLASRSNLALAYRDAGRVQEALHLHMQVLAGVEALFGSDHPRVLASRSNLANSYRDVGRAQEALHLHEQIIAERQHILGPDHPDTLTSRSNLALAYRDAGRSAEAIRLHEEVLTDRQRVFGPDHPDTLTSRSNLALAYRKAGRTQDALGLHTQLLTDHERIFGPDHPHTLTARDDLASSYDDAGRTQVALELRERVVTDRQRVLGHDHPSTLTSHSNLALSYRKTGRMQEALRLREQVLADHERVLGADHPHTLAARNNLANSYQDLGRLQDALSLRERVLAGHESTLGPDHPHTLTARDNLALSYSEAGRTEEALRLRDGVLGDVQRLGCPRSRRIPEHACSPETRSDQSSHCPSISMD